MKRNEILAVAAIAAVWLPGGLALARVWSEVDYASHGFLVPLVALWTATAHRARLAELTPQPTPIAGLGLAAAALVYLGALLLDDATVIGLAAVATVVFTVWGLRGPAWVSQLRFPLAYLLFMVPLPAAWVTPLILRLQLWVSTLAIGILQRAGVAIHREGNVLTLPGDASLFVAEACSGITSLITLLPIGVFVAYFSEVRPLRRGLLVAAVVPIALAGNLLRVLLTVGLAIGVSVEVATRGPLHEWLGVGTYVLGCLCLIGVGAAMRALWPDRPAAAAP